MSRTSPPPPPMYYTPDGAKSVNDVGGGKIWTVEDEDDDDEKMTGIKFLWEYSRVKHSSLKIFFLISVYLFDIQELMSLMMKKLEFFWKKNLTTFMRTRSTNQQVLIIYIYSEIIILL